MYVKGTYYKTKKHFAGLMRAKCFYIKRSVNGLFVII